MIRDQLVSEARNWIGTPYRHQASLKGVGCDCAGLVRGLWRAFCGPEPQPLPAYSPEWAEVGGVDLMHEAARQHLIAIDLTEAAPGDVLLFRWRDGLPAKHAGILVAEGRFVHAQEGAAVTEVPLGRWWRTHMAAAFRFPGLDASET